MKKINEETKSINFSIKEVGTWKRKMNKRKLMKENEKWMKEKSKIGWKNEKKKESEK